MMSGHDGEIEALKAGVSCAVVLERRGWQPGATHEILCWCVGGPLF